MKVSGLLLLLMSSFQTAAQIKVITKSDVGVNLWNRNWATKEIPFKTGANLKAYGDIWNPAFIDDIKVFNFVRFMDWGGTNGSSVGSWSSRTELSSASITNVPIEHMIGLCNTANINAWFCIPHRVISSDPQPASSDYCERLAILIKTGVDMGTVSLAGLGDLSTKTQADFIAAGGKKTCEPLKSNLKAYIEYSNETWNPQFGQFAYCQEKGKALGFSLSGVDYAYSYRFTVYAAVRVFEKFQKVFGTEMSTRIVKVLAAQANNSFAAINIYLPALKDIKYNPKGIKPDYFSIANYFSTDPATELEATNVDGLMRAAENEYKTFMEIAPHVDMAGMRINCYEGGTHFTTESSRKMNFVPQIYNAFIAMTQKVSIYSDVLAQYTLTDGSWGCKEYTGQPMTETGALRYKALFDFMTATRALTPDVVKPSTTGPLTLTEVSGNFAKFKFTKATDDRFLKFYKAYVNDVLYQTVNYTDTSFFVRDLKPLTSYTLKVIAEDAWGNKSDPQTLTIKTRESLPDIYIKKISTPITIDGTEDDVWKSMPSVPMNKIILSKTTTPVQPSDLSANFKVAYDDVNLYVYMTVTDDKSITNQYQACNDVWTDDCIELYIDIGNDKSRTYGANDFHIGFISSANTICYTSAVTYVRAFKSFTGGYTAEVSLKWSSMRQLTPPVEGTRMGFEVHVNDDDEDNVNGTQRDHKLGWFYTADEATRNPSTFGTAEFSTSKAGESDFSVGEISRRINNDSYVPFNIRKTLNGYDVSFSANSGDAYTVEIYNVMGKRISALRGTVGSQNRVGLNVPSNNVPGTYLIKVSAGKSKFTKQFIVDRD